MLQEAICLGRILRSLSVGVKESQGSRACLKKASYLFTTHSLKNDKLIICIAMG